MYQKRTNKNKNEDAVSPVVGVMLMLVVTIVIAAVVAAFATGIVGDQKTAPTVSASVDLNTIEDEDKVTVTFISVSEPIAKSDLQLNLKSTKEGVLYGQSGVLGSSGAIISGSTVSAGLSLEDTSGAKPLDPAVTVKDKAISGEISQYFTKYATTDEGHDGKLKIVYLDGTTPEKTDVDENTDPEINAMIKIKGNTGGAYKYVTCKPGYSIAKEDDSPLQKLEIEELEAGDKVNVEIVHIPSNSIVYAKTITVGA